MLEPKAVTQLVVSPREFYNGIVRSGLLGALIRPGTLRVLPWLLRTKPSSHTLYGLYAAAVPRKLALVSVKHGLNYEQLWNRIRGAVRALATVGLGPGATATLLLGNRPEFFEIQAAASLLRARLLLASTSSSSHELAYLTADSGSQLLIFDSTLAEVVRRSRLALANLLAVGGEVGGARCYDELTRGEPGGAFWLGAPRGQGAIIQYTSGTTGRPKGAVREQGPSALPALIGFLSVVPIRHADRHLVACPLYHTHGLGLATVSFSVGATVYLLERFSPKAFVSAVSRWEISSTALVPTMLSDIARAFDRRRLRRQLRSLRCIVSSGAALPPTLRRQWAELLGGDVIYDMYGATELGWVTVATPQDARFRPTTIGRAVPGTEVLILDGRGGKCARGRAGEIFARSPLVFSGYHGLRRNAAAGGRGSFCSVGDLGWQDADGFYYLCGRKHDMIISGGVNVYPAEVEAVLLSHPAIREAAVVGMPDPRWGERVCAAVVAEQRELTEEELVCFCRLRLGAPKVPKQVVFCGTLPKTETGKIIKSRVRELMKPLGAARGEIAGHRRQAQP